MKQKDKQDDEDFFESKYVETLCIGIVACHFIFGTGLFSYVCAWTPFEAMWFSVVTLTTVGYGDYVPNANNTQKLFGILYIWLSITVIGTCIGILASKSMPDEEDASKARAMDRITQIFGHHSKGVKRLILIILFILFGVLTFPHIEEGWSYIDGFYYATVTLSSVGYGAITPVTMPGRTLAMFYMFIGVVSTSTLISGIIDGVLQVKKDKDRESFCERAMSPKKIQKLRAKTGYKDITRLDFLLHMLEETKLAEKDELDCICEAFDIFDLSGSGFIVPSEISKHPQFHRHVGRMARRGGPRPGSPRQQTAGLASPRLALRSPRLQV